MDNPDLIPKGYSTYQWIGLGTTTGQAFTIIYRGLRSNAGNVDAPFLAQACSEWMHYKYTQIYMSSCVFAFVGGGMYVCMSVCTYVGR